MADFITDFGLLIAGIGAVAFVVTVKPIINAALGVARRVSTMGR